MTNEIAQELYSEFTKLIDAGDEQGAKDFLADHFGEFPEDVQAKIAFAFLKEEITHNADEATVVEGVQKQAMDTISALIKQGKDVENNMRIDELKKELGTS